MSYLISLLVLSLDMVLFSPSIVSSGQWVNPRDVMGDPIIARLQQGRKKLTQEEEEEIKRYGYTGLEIMTYLDDNTDPGQTHDNFYRLLKVDANGHIMITEWLRKIKYYYKDNLSLLTYKGIKPGDVEIKRIAVQLYPPEGRGSTVLILTYLKSEKVFKQDDGWLWSSSLRKIRRYPAMDKEDGVEGSEMTFDDFYWREPWEENHKILGEDIVNGYKCFVIESKNRLNPNYYLSKRVTWVEKEKFLDFHEEQFDRKNRIFKVIDKDWHQVKPWNYWVRWQLNYINLGSKTGTLAQFYDFIFDFDIEDGEFSRKGLEKGDIWRKPDHSLPPIQDVSDLPPRPKVRREFWDKIGVRPEVVG